MSQIPPHHGPNRFRNYIETHETIFNQFKDRGFVGVDTLEFRPLKNAFLLGGEIGCLGGIVVRVEKLIAVVSPLPVNNPLVQTVWYSYNVSVRNHFNIFRYDNQDDDFSFRLDHQDAHHKHVFDWQTGNELSDSPIWVGAEKWPLLSQVLEEAEAWYWEHRGYLSQPDNYPDIVSYNHR